MKLSAQQRQARSERAKLMHQRGQLGAKRRVARSPAERPRTASDLARDLIVENETEIRRQVKQILKTGSAAQRVKVTELLLKTSLSAERLDSGERKAELQHQSREELIALLAGKLTSGPTAAIIRGQIEADVIEGSAEVVELRK